MSGPKTIVYGIPNCDTVKKARTWLETHGVPFDFHDFKKAGLPASLVKAWLADIPLEALVNRRGTTWRGLPDEAKAAAETEAGAIALMVEKPSVVKRPVLVVDGRVKSLGFSPEQYETLFR
ncbi:ArsC family reductase [Trinickia caryophylli]|uniref:Transcriptional regulator, Spx/MgsR family n=1 Tax=Trinickia caryophylli TaxID=28094 RepID=A0A1X7DK58_TRICW|nr:ArsC family reductase [Trinickia caryophylli]PMS12255.1 ArsC family reductase [Trinickia caryophylli]TRX17077.1 ArsC family reductase [Trinickia caryophylli]WQE12189.1 ArsC family reductase [Trinickia caryophylli]SMF16687.1 transcriptional regulator, Spx/MgsR family [Trinickia caryophylli]GLU31676.1 arsenate reductase [Trinickia caryophylli]